MGVMRLVSASLALALIIGGVVMVFTDTRVDRRTGALFSDEDTSFSSAQGTVHIDTILRDPSGVVIRRVDPVVGGNIIDPETEQEIGTYEVNVHWTCTGENIDWGTLNVTGRLVYDQYIGVNDRMEPWPDDRHEEIGTLHSKEQESQFTFTSDIDELMPDNIVYVYRDYNPETQRMETYTDIFPQRTAEDHAMIFKFSGRFEVSVADLWGNPYNDVYNINIELRLAWRGSDFDVEWSTDSGSTSTTTTSTTTTTSSTTTTTSKSSTTTTPDTRPEPTLPFDSDLSLDMDDLTSDELVYLSRDESMVAASIFGGTHQEDAGVVLIGVGVVILALTLLMPATPHRRR